MLEYTEAYLEPIRTSAMEFNMLTIFAKTSPAYNGFKWVLNMLKKRFNMQVRL